MKTTKNILVIAFLAISSASIAQFPKALPKTPENAEAVTDSSEILLDNVLKLSTSNDNAATAAALN